MKVVFADSFWKSIKKLNRQNTWYYKLYELFRYKIPWFIRNIGRFKKELWYYRTWDGRYALMMFARSIKLTKECIEKYGTEADESRFKKIAMMNRAIELLENVHNDKYISKAEKQLGYEMDHTGFWNDEEEGPEARVKNSELCKLSWKLEEEEWKEVWEIIHGFGSKNYDESNGSGIKGWWD